MTGRTLWLALALAPCSFATNAQARPDWLGQVRAVDAEFRQAMIRGDAAAIARIVADDARIIHGGNGAIQDKRGLIERFRSYRIDRYDRTPLLSKIDHDLALLVSITRKVANGHETDTSTTEVFVRRGGRWQILVLQNTDHTAG